MMYSKKKGHLHTRATDDQIKRIIELYDDGYMFQGVSSKLKEDGMSLNRETVKKILIINGYEFD